MKTKNIFTGLFALLVISIVGIGASFAHGEDLTDNSNGDSTYSDMEYGMGQGMMNSNMGSEIGSGMIGSNMNDMYNRMKSFFTGNSGDELDNFENSEYSMGSGSGMGSGMGYGMSSGSGMGYGMMR